MTMKFSTMFKRIIEQGELGQYELGWVDYPDNVVGRTNLYRELDRDISEKIGVSPNCHSSFYLERQERLKKAQKMLYDLGNRLSKRGAIDFMRY